MSSPVGTRLDGRYRLEALIGTGGMSMVYRAFDETLEREVAIKLMNREIAADSAQLERFRREARAVARLSHPHIVGVIDAGEDEGRPYIVFEYVEGETLKERIRRLDRLDVVEAVAYAIEIARALGGAHSRRIVHRDVKPQNVLIDAEGSAKVTDFGIARSLEEHGLTVDGRVLGTTDYVSPEQALGHDVTPQSDLYSLGIVLYEMLTGEVPFKGENQVAVAMKHVREALPDVRLRRPEVSAALASVVDRATAKSLHRRYVSDDELIADLEEVLAIEAARSGQATGEATSVLRTLPGSARRRLPLRIRHRWRLLLVTLLVIGVGVGVAVALINQAHRGTGPDRAAPPAPKGEAQVSLAASAAHAYDPVGGDGEHDSSASAVLDRDGNTLWQTETYSAGLNKAGVGIYLDAAPGVVAKALSVRTSTPGFEASVYAANGSTPPAQQTGETRLAGWQQIATGTTLTKSRNRLTLNTAGRRYRYYLLWITKLPPSGGKAEIQEMSLYA